MRIRTILLLALLTGACYGQTVTVQATVQDSRGNIYQGGSGRAVLVSGNGSGQQQWLFNGTNPVRTPLVINNLDSFGHFSMPVTNTSQISPGSALPQWQFSFCSAPPPACSPQVCFTLPPQSLSSNTDFSALAQTYAAPLPPSCASSMHLTVNYEHNSLPVASEPTLNFIDTTGVFTVTNDAPNSRVNVSVTGSNCPAGAINDVQLYGSAGNCNSDTGVFTENPSTHTMTVGAPGSPGTIVATKEVDVTDSSQSGEVNLTTGPLGSAVSAGVVGIAAPLSSTNGVRYILPDSPGTDNQVVTQVSHSGTDVTLGFNTVGGSTYNYENLIPLWITNCPLPSLPCANDLISTPLPWGESMFYGGPLPGTEHLPYVLSPTTAHDDTGTSSNISITYASPLIPGDMIIVQFNGVGASAFCNVQDSQGDVFVPLNFGNFYAKNVVGGITTVTAEIRNLSCGGSLHAAIWQAMVSPVHGANKTTPVDAASTDTTGCTGSNPNFTSITTANPAAIVALVMGSGSFSAGYSTYTPGTGYIIGNQIKYGPSGGISGSRSLAIESGPFVTPGTYTPSMTADANCSTETYAIAIIPESGTSADIPAPRIPRYVDLAASGDFPPLAGESGKLFSTDGNVVTLVTAPVSGVAQIDVQNNGTPYGSVTAGQTGTFNFANCTATGIAPSFTITCPTGISVAGSSGDLQMNNGSGNLAAAHINDNGSVVYFSEPTSFYLATAGTGGVTAKLLAAADNSNPTRFVLPSAGNCGFGFAATSATVGNTFLLESSVQEDYIGVADNNITAGHILIGGTTTPGRVKDSAATQITGVPVGTCIVGKALTSASTGGDVTVLYMGLGTFGTSGTATYTGSPAAGRIPVYTASAGQTQNSNHADFSAAPTTGDLVSCTTAGGVCTLTDSGVLATNVLLDPGANGLLTRTALGTTGVATAHNVASILLCSDTSGSGTVQSCATSPTFTPVAGDWVLYKTTTQNTGDVTVDINSLGAKHIRKWLGAAVLAAGDIPASKPMLMVYDGTYWEIATIGNVPSGSGGSPGGSPGQLQYNASGSFGGDTATTDGSGNLTVTSLGAGASPPTCGASATGCVALSEAGTAGTPATGLDYLRADSTAHCIKMSLNNGAEACIPTSSGATTIVPPQGRLTLVSGTPVMTANETAKSTIYYDCYNGNKIPYYNGSADVLGDITSCELSTTMQTSGTGVTNTTSVFDVWYAPVAGTICVATDGSGAGWAGDTAGSNTARGTGYSQIDITRGYWTNTNAITHCYNGATDEGSLTAHEATYLGTIYTTAAGKTGMNYNPAAAAGGSAGTVLGVYNAYNRVTSKAYSRDSTASWTYATATWEAMDAGATGSGLNNRVTWVDGLAQSTVRIEQSVLFSSSSGHPEVGASCDSTTAAPAITAGNTGSNIAPGPTSDFCLPAIGLHYTQAMQYASAATSTFYGADSGVGAQRQYVSAELEN